MQSRWPSDWYPRRTPYRQNLYAVLHQVLDRMGAAEQFSLGADGTQTPVSSGIAELDAVLDGGIRTGELTIVSLDSAVHRRAFTATATRSSPAPCILAVAEPVDAALLMIAGESGLPEVILRTCELDSADWHQFHAAVDRLMDREIHFAGVGRIEGLRAASHGGLAVTIVDRLERFGPPGKVMLDLKHLAAETDTAVLATTALSADTFFAPPLAANVVAIVSMTLGSSATLIETTRLHCVLAPVEPLTGCFGTRSER